MPLMLDCRKATTYIRTSSHTCIREDDPDLKQLLSFGRWDQHTHIHVWLAEAGPEVAEASHIKAYLGSVPLWNHDDIDRARVRRLIKKLVQSAPKDQIRQLCRQLRSALRNSA